MSLCQRFPLVCVVAAADTCTIVCFTHSRLGKLFSCFDFFYPLFRFSSSSF